MSEKISVRLGKTAAAVAGFAALTGAGCAQPSEVDTRTADQKNICVAGPDTQEFTYKRGQGFQDAVHAIEGSGNGEGDACWSEAMSVVTKATQKAGDLAPVAMHTITIPVELHPVKGDE